MAKVNWNYETTYNAIKSSKTYADALRSLGLPVRSGNYGTITKYCKKYNISTDHFTSQAHGTSKPPNRIPTEAMFTVDSTVGNGSLKARIIRENLIPYKCSLCSINEWQGKRLVLVLDHINGTPLDNRLENLRFLCPNCNSQQATFCRGDKKLARQKRNEFKFVCSCGSNKTELASHCQKCFAGYVKRQYKIVWPDYNTLSSMIETNGYVGTGKLLGVSDNAVKKAITRLSKV